MEIVKYIQPSNGISDKVKFILSRETAKDWNADDRVEDGYKDTMIPKKNQIPVEEGYRSDYPFPSKPFSSRIPLQSPFKGQILRKTNESINGNPFYKDLKQKIVSVSSTTVELSDGKLNRYRHSPLKLFRSLKGNILYRYFFNQNVEVGQKRQKLWKQNNPQKHRPKNRKQIEFGSSDNNTRTRVSRPSMNPSRRQPPRSKKLTILPGYLATDESMFITSVSSNISDWECIAGGFPCRDAVRERIISDSITNLKQYNNTDNSPEANDNIKVEILEDNQDDELITSQWPNSIIPPESTTTTQERDSKNNSTTPLKKDSPVNFPFYEIVGSSDEALPKPKSTPKPGNEPPTRRSNRNVGPPSFYGKIYFVNFVDEPQVVSGTASNPIVLDNNISEHSDLTHQETLSDIVTIQSDPSSPDLHSSSSMDES